MRPSKLKSCVFCGYSLKGLPDEHVCPECGFPYNKRSQVITQSARSAYGNVLWGVVFGFLLLVGVVALLTGSSNTDITLWDVFTSCIYLSFVGSAIAAWPILMGRRNRAVISMEGITLWDGRNETATYTWEQVKAVKVSRVLGNVILTDGADNEVTAVDADFFGSSRRINAFRTAVKEWQQRYSEARAAVAGRIPSNLPRPKARVQPQRPSKGSHGPWTGSWSG